MENYKLKLSIFIILLIILLSTLYYGIFGFSVSYLSEDEIKENRELKENLVSYFKINGIETIYDKTTDIYYYSVPLDQKDKKYTLKLELDDGYKYKIKKQTTNVITVDYEKTYNIIIYNEKNYSEIKLKLTNLPIVSILSDTDVTDNDTNSVFKYINPSNLDNTITYNSKIHIRGATSKLYDKKSYKVNIYNSDYEKEKNINISNFYYGSSFILDALYRDGSKIRNALATQLWNDFSSDFTNANVYTEFVEVFINNEYKGLYLFMEPVNRRNLNLNSSSLNNTSVVIKSSDYNLPKFNDYTNIIDDVYYGFELKYPNDEDLFNTSWNSILNKLSKYYKNTINSSYEQINDIFDITSYVDLILFNSVTNNEDNHLIKNNYFYQKELDDKIYIQPWDMEFSFGLSYSHNLKYNTEETLYDFEEIIFEIKHSSPKINKLLIKKYWNVRNNILTIEYFDNIIDKYKATLGNGAASRDSNLYYEYNFDENIEEVRDWIHKRLEVYDEYVRGLENE